MSFGGSYFLCGEQGNIPGFHCNRDSIVGSLRLLYHIDGQKKFDTAVRLPHLMGCLSSMSSSSSDDPRSHLILLHCWLLGNCGVQQTGQLCMCVCFSLQEGKQ